MRLARGWLIFAALLCASAQGQQAHPLIEGSPLERATEAFDNPYGGLLVKTFARILRQSASPACVAERSILPHRWEDEARQILVRRGGQMLHRQFAAQDMQRFDALLATLIGSGARAEIVRLRAHPEVRELRALARPARLARLADHISDTVDRYALLNRFALRGRIAPISSGDEALRSASPEEKSDKDVEAFLARTQSPEVTRYLQLEEDLGRVSRNAARTEEMLKLGPSQMMAGLDEDLLALCVGRRP